MRGNTMLESMAPAFLYDQSTGGRLCRTYAETRVDYDKVHHTTEKHNVRLPNPSCRGSKSRYQHHQNALKKLMQGV